MSHKKEKIIFEASFPKPEPTETVRVKFAPLYSGGECDIDGFEEFDGPVIADIDTLEIDTDPPALIDHNPDWVAGKLENIQIETDADGNTSVTCDAVVGGSLYAQAVLDYFRNGPVNLKPSIGIRRIRDYNIEHYTHGETVRVNGRTFRGPVNIVRHGHLSEGSFVTLAGDPNAKAFLAKLKTEVHRMTFEDFLNSKGIDPAAFDALSAEEQEALRAEFDALGAGTGDGGDAGAGLGNTEDEDGNTETGLTEEGEAVQEAVEEVVEEAVAEGEITAEEATEIFEEVLADTEKELEAAEEEPENEKEAKARARKIAGRKLQARIFRARIRKRKTGAVTEQRRQAAIKAFCAGYGRKGGEIAGRAIAGGWTFDKTQKVMQASFARDTKLNQMKRAIPAGGGNTAGRPSKQDVMTAAFAMTCKLKPDYVKKHFGFSDSVMNAAMERGNRNVTLKRLIVDSVNSFQAGYANVGTSMLDVVPAMRRFCRQRKEREAGDRNFAASLGFSTISATDVLHAIVQAYLLDQQAAAPTFYRNITKEAVFSDFNSVDAYLPTLIGQLSKISETGQIEHVSYTTEKITAKTEPLGATFAIPEMVLINDQLNVFVELLQQLRDLPEKCVEHDVAKFFWRLVDGDINAADGNAFFSTTRKNILTGSTTVLSEAGLNTATNALDSMKDPNGAPVGSDGAFIVTSSALFATAQRLYVSENLNVVDTVGDRNVYQGVYKPYKWPYLNSDLARAYKDNGSTASDFQTYKATMWFLFRSPDIRPIMSVNKLVGYESPQIKQFDSDPSTWGSVYQLIYPYSVSAVWPDGAIVMRGNAS